ncbi:MAG TPA: hypothetical protein VNR18_04390 [Hyphomicrobiales bacterium]|nr:hypothetical protein [Hyphomicrobiales bacterium]
MHTFLSRLLFATLLALFGFQVQALAAEAGARGPAPRPALFFEEAWQQAGKGGEAPIVQDHVANPALELKRYGPKSDELQITGIAPGEAGYDANPIHTWSGLCGAGCTFALRHKDSYADLSGAARIMVQSKTSGFHKIHPFIRLADGSTYVGDIELGQTYDFLFEEFRIQQVHWIAFNTDLGVTKGNLVDDIDLSKVDEIGFTDLQPGADHGPGGWSDVAVVRVYANAVPR